MVAELLVMSVDVNVYDTNGLPLLNTFTTSPANRISTC